MGYGVAGVRAPSVQQRRILRLIIQSSSGEVHGYQLMKLSGIPSGSLYPHLRILAERGYVSAELSESTCGRPRKVYQVTALGLRWAWEHEVV